MEVSKERQFSPYFASINYDPAQDTERDRLEFSRKFFSLSKIVKYGFLSKEIEEEIKDISNRYNVTDIRNIGEISRMVRGYYLNGQESDVWADSAKDKIKLDAAKIQAFVADVGTIVGKIQTIGAEILKDSVEKLPIIPALKKYETLGDQEITNNQIEIEIEERREFVNPNIKNWLEDYIQNKGAQAHNNLERSDYLYKSKNTEELSGDERGRLSMVLASYDKDELLAINKDQEEVLFDNTLSILDGLGKEHYNIPTNGGSADAKAGAIELAPIQDAYLQKKEGQEELKDENISKKSHEISWYGTDPFDGLEKIEGNKKNQTKQPIKMEMRRNDQATRHVVDLKNG